MKCRNFLCGMRGDHPADDTGCLRYDSDAMRECEQRKAYNRIVAQRHGLYWQSDADRFTGAKFVEERTKARKK